MHYNMGGFNNFVGAISASGDVTYLISHVTSLDRVIEGSSNVMGGCRGVACGGGGGGVGGCYTPPSFRKMVG